MKSQKYEAKSLNYLANAGVEIILFPFFSGAMSLVSVKVFNLRLDLHTKPGILNILLIVTGAIGLWLLVTPLVQINLNLHPSDFRNAFDRAVPISTTHLVEVQSRIIRSGDSYDVDLTESCRWRPSIPKRLTLGRRFDYQSTDPVFWIAYVEQFKENLDLDPQDEEILIFECGSNDSYYTAHLFDGSRVFQIEVGNRASKLTIRNGEIAITKPGGGPRCCPTTAETRFYHYRSGRLIEHKAREVRPW